MGHMPELFEQAMQAARDTLSNDIVSGGFVLMLFGSGIALMRNLPVKLMNLLMRQFTVTVDVVSGDALFGWLSTWLDAHPYSKSARRVTASSSNKSGDPARSPTGSPRVLFTPAPGNHLLWLGRRPIWLSRDRKEQPVGREGWSFLQETIELRMIGRDPNAARKILEDARDLAYRDDPTVGVYVCRWGEWHRIYEAAPRPLDTVILPAGVLEDITADAEAFLDSREWYQRRGIPWRRGYLFEGTPGTGKTSAIAAIAGHLKLDLYMCNVTGAGMTDERLIANLLSVNVRSAVVLEDVDCVVEGREMKSEGVTFSGLLNALDGVASKPGVLTFLTTNHPDRLDGALLRNGRVDRRITFEPSTVEQASRFFKKFYEENDLGLSDDFGCLAEGRPMSELQGVLIEYKDDPQAAIARLNSL